LGLIAKQLRIHQWVKNILLFVPAIAGHLLFEEGIFIEVFLAFCTFCLVASGIYIINDIHDINNDRNHPINKERHIPQTQSYLL
jgi:4-hydroxybenzoate polyprenyltransferase